MSLKTALNERRRPSKTESSACRACLHALTYEAAQTPKTKRFPPLKHLKNRGETEVLFGVLFSIEHGLNMLLISKKDQPNLKERFFRG